MGLELDGSRLVGAVGGLEPQSGALRVDGAAVASIPDRTEGSDADVELASLIAEVRSRLPRAPHRVRLGVGGPDTAMRLIEVPHPRRQADLEAVIEQEAEQRVPVPLARAHWTARVLDSFSDAEGARRARVLIAAAKRSLVDPLCSAARESGCEVVGVDLSAFAAIRALPPRHDVWLGAVLGAQATLFVANGRDCLLTRAPGDLAAVAASAGEGDAAGAREAAGHLVREIRKTCQYQATIDSAATVSHVALTGQGAGNAELVRSIAVDLDLPVSVEAPVGAEQSGPTDPCGSTIAGGLCVEAVA